MGILSKIFGGEDKPILTLERIDGNETAARDLYNNLNSVSVTGSLEKAEIIKIVKPGSKSIYAGFSAEVLWGISELKLRTYSFRGNSFFRKVEKLSESNELRKKFLKKPLIELLKVEAKRSLSTGNFLFTVDEVFLEELPHMKEFVADYVRNEENIKSINRFLAGLPPGDKVEEGFKLSAKDLEEQYKSRLLVFEELLVALESFKVELQQAMLKK
ncbi:MAG: hypothetical protein WC595_02300 [Candidatus Nanoarchaeia archaeon]